MNDDIKVNRRKFLKVAGGIVGIGVAACGGTAYFGTRTPASVVFPYVTCGSTDGKKVLVTYASRSGATGEIAAKIVKVLCEANFLVDLRRINDVDAVDGYQAAVIGSPVYMGSVMGDCVSFIEKHQGTFQDIPTAFFGVGLAMKEDTPESREEMVGYFAPAIDALQPDLVDYFGGRINLDTLPFLYRMFAQMDSEGILAEGDFRDWDAIRNWGSLVAEAFS